MNIANKKIQKQYITALLISILFAGCNYSKGIKTDLRTGLSFNYNGFGVQDVVLLDPNNTPMSSNKVSVNTKISIAALGITNYALKEGKVFPGMMLLVTDKKGASVINADDLFEGTQGYPRKTQPSYAATSL